MGMVRTEGRLADREPAAEQRDRLGAVAALEREARELGDGERGVGVGGPDRGLEHRERALLDLDGLVDATGHVDREPEVVERAGELGVALAVELLRRAHDLAVVTLGCHVIAGVVGERAEDAGEPRVDIWISRHALDGGLGDLRERGRLDRLAELLVRRQQEDHRVEPRDVVARALRDLQPLLEHRDRAGDVTGARHRVGLVVEQRPAQRGVGGWGDGDQGVELDQRLVVPTERLERADLVERDLERRAAGLELRRRRHRPQLGRLQAQLRARDRGERALRGGDLRALVGVRDVRRELAAMTRQTLGDAHRPAARGLARLAPQPERAIELAGQGLGRRPGDLAHARDPRGA